MESQPQETKPISIEEKESRLKEGLLFRISTCNDVVCLAEIKKESLVFEDDQKRMEIRDAILKRFENHILVQEVYKIQ